MSHKDARMVVSVGFDAEVVEQIDRVAALMPISPHGRGPKSNRGEWIRRACLSQLSAASQFDLDEESLKLAQWYQAQPTDVRRCIALVAAGIRLVADQNSGTLKGLPSGSEVYSTLVRNTAHRERRAKTRPSRRRKRS